MTSALVESSSNANTEYIKSEIKLHVDSIKKVIKKKLDFDFFENILGYIYRYHTTYINKNSTILSILLIYGNPYGVVYNGINDSMSVLHILKQDCRLEREYSIMKRFYKLIQNDLV